MSGVPGSTRSRILAAPGVLVEGLRWLWLTRGLRRSRYLAWRESTAFATVRGLTRSEKWLSAFDYLAWARSVRRVG